MTNIYLASFLVYYKFRHALAPQVLDAHPRLAELGPIYPAGLALFLPSADRLAPPTTRRITLWGRA